MIEWRKFYQVEDDIQILNESIAKVSTGELMEGNLLVQIIFESGVSDDGRGEGCEEDHEHCNVNFINQIRMEIPVSYQSSSSLSVVSVLMRPADPLQSTSDACVFLRTAC